jgi:hypothetical protein
VRERVRSFLGVWAPMILGVILVALAVNFLVSPRSPSAYPSFVVDPVGAFVCGGIVILIGGLLMLSTYGRWRKARAARPPDPDRQKNV